jgi:thioredoxin 2
VRPVSRHGDLLVLKLDIDRAQAVAARFGVRSIPTLILFSGGRELRRQVGLVDATRLRAFAGLS